MTIMFSFPPFEPNLVLMLFHINFKKEFKTLVQTQAFPTFVVIDIAIKQRINNRGEKQLLIANGEREFNKNVITSNNDFIIKYGQSLKTYNGS